MTLTLLEVFIILCNVLHSTPYYYILDLIFGIFPISALEITEKLQKNNQLFTQFEPFELVGHKNAGI